ncbi:hypothetical protein [Streptomyces capoamus]|uniref:hypothetical protein n=1 Tax=Streptomyces capoamus TaxID=68183 RepID=UPI0033914C09
MTGAVRGDRQRSHSKRGILLILPIEHRCGNRFSRYGAVVGSCGDTPDGLAELVQPHQNPRVDVLAEVGDNRERLLHLVRMQAGGAAMGPSPT